ncbi:MAG: AMP-binding protein [Desulfobacteraceae bacterium]|nr:AMP-binding protein [Desulfobacteraceae bacterium]
MGLSARQDSDTEANRTGKNYNFSRYLRQSAETFPDKKGIVLAAGRNKDGGAIYDSMTLGELDRLSDSFALGLEKSGIHRGTKTVLMAKPGKDFFPLTMALFKIGAVPVIVDPGMGIGRMLHCIKSTRPEAFIGIPPAHVVRLLAPGSFKSLKTWVTVGRRWFWRGGTTSAMKENPGANHDIAHAAASDLAAIIFTTGSTGPAKGVEYTHGMFDGMISQLINNFNPGEDEIDLATFPLYTLFDVSLGITAVLPDMNPASPAKAKPEKIVEAIQDQNVTTMFGSPALLKNLSVYCRKKEITLPTVGRVLSGAAPVTPEVMEGIEDLLGDHARFFVTYGATEAAPVSAMDSHDVLKETRFDTERGKGSCIGLPFKGIDVKIIPITDEPWETLDRDSTVPPGTIGEIIVRGDIVSTRYFERPDEDTLSKIHHGDETWHRMGDLGWLDEKGRIWYCGRKKDRIIAPQKTYYTIPCEAVFNTHQAVSRSALVGVEVDSAVSPVVCVELHDKFKKANREKITGGLRIMAEQNAVTTGIETFLFYDSFPVDIRHNIKIDRAELAVRANRQITKKG